MVIFWDTSAVVPLLVAEPTSADVVRVAQASTILAWWGTPVECASAIARREREGTLTPETTGHARDRLRVLRENWNEVQPSEQIRVIAERLLLRHALRAADALQLAAALRWADNNPQGHLFHTLDQRLSDAARREGFELVDAAEFASEEPPRRD